MGAKSYIEGDVERKSKSLSPSPCPYLLVPSLSSSFCLRLFIPIFCPHRLTISLSPFHVLSSLPHILSSSLCPHLVVPIFSVPISLTPRLSVVCVACSIQGNLHSTLRKSNSTILSGPTNCEPYQPEAPSFIDRLTQPDDGTLHWLNFSILNYVNVK